MPDTRRWQYQVMHVKTDIWGRDDPEALQQALNDAGSEGWELVCALHPYGARGATLYFKRPL